MKPDDLSSDPFVDALREDFPSAAAEARVRSRLAALGVVAAGVLATKSALGAGLAGKGTLGKAGLLAEAFARFGGLSLGAKAGVATVAGALAAGGPIWIASHVESPEPAIPPASKAVSAPARPQAPRAPESREVTPRAIETSEPEASSEGSAAFESERGPVREARPRLAQPRKLAQRPAPSGASRELPADTARDQDQEPARGEPAEAGTNAAGSALKSSSLRTRLSEETALMDAAFAALSRGDRATAQRFVHEHARRFPNGELRSERERAEALLARAPQQ